jgi:protein-S-isoprenylcysteine O-methyltransferase Ste14
MYLPVGLPRPLYALSEGAKTAAGMSGVFLDHLTPQRVGVSLTVLLFATLSLARGLDEAPEFAVVAFAVALIARHAFAFASFTPNGIAPTLKARLGSELGCSIHEALMALLIFAQRLSFIRLLLATANDPSDSLGSGLISCGAGLFALGVGVSVWATRIIGLEAYYYRDLCGGPRYVRRERRGPYALLANPLYGVGQLAAYGAALMLLSPIGVLAVSAHQAALYAFNAVVEQPQLRAAATDSALRETLSRTLLDPARAVPERLRRPALPPRKARPRRTFGVG